MPQAFLSIGVRDIIPFFPRAGGMITLKEKQALEGADMARSPMKDMCSSGCGEAPLTLMEQPERAWPEKWKYRYFFLRRT